MIELLGIDLAAGLSGMGLVVCPGVGNIQPLCHTTEFSNRKNYRFFQSQKGAFFKMSSAVASVQDLGGQRRKTCFQFDVTNVAFET